MSGCNQPVSGWTLHTYRKLCEGAVKAGYRVTTVAGYLRAPAEGTLILRHDIDRYPANAREMAHLEHELGIHSTYYVRMIPEVFSPSLVRTLSSLGHEVGYHFEVYSKSGGDASAAEALFREELKQLRTLIRIHTCAAHGSPLSRWDNQAWFAGYKARDFDLLGDAYRDIDFSRVSYVTDTGRSWNSVATNLRDRVGGQGTGHGLPPASTRELYEGLCSQRWPVICLQTHPERWSYSTGTHLRSLAWDSAANGAKYLIRLYREKFG